jgi:hypothetical protein
MEELRDALARLPGYADARVGLDCEERRLVVVPSWDSEKHARFPRGSIFDLVARMGHAGARFEPPEIYELVVD